MAYIKAISSTVPVVASPGGPEGVVLGPVHHADHRRHTVDDQHAGADFQGFAGKGHDGEDGLMGQYQRKTHQENEPAGKGTPAAGGAVWPRPIRPRPLLCPPAPPRVGKAREEADDQPLQGAENGGGGDGLLDLTAQHHVDDHVAHADEHLVAEDGEAFAQVNGHLRPGPAEMPGEGKQIRMLLATGQQKNGYHVDQSGAHRGQGRALNAHGRAAPVCRR